jgi:pimeloyl-ACP methyl ester carboxylesterase
VTSRYSYRLLTNFAAPTDLAAAFRGLKIPTTIIAGSADELMESDKYAEMVRGVEPTIDVKIVPNLNHMDMLHAAAAIDAIGTAFKEK